MFERSAGAAAAALPRGYRPRRPEQTVLYELVSAYREPMLRHMREVDEHVLRRVRTGHDRRVCASNAILVLYGDSWRFATLPSRCPSTGRSPSACRTPWLCESPLRRPNVADLK